MGYIVLSSMKDTDPAQFDNKKLLSDVDLDRVAMWAAVKYFPNGVLVPGDPNAEPPVQDSYRNPTGAEVFLALTDDIYAKIKGEVDAWHYAQIKAQIEPMVEAQFVPITLKTTS